ncbi:MAG: hypothetical protein CMI16_12500 [Opitutaceae bacterium]|nr:hypothetical protein [Opitutaceae bacterium]|tara:strand:- start:402 stop:863 length:462 start_codon:yes stop_codon:yes gene_type:complete
MSHDETPSCDTLREWADTNCSDNLRDTSHGLVRVAVLEVERELFERTRGGGAKLVNADLTKKLTVALDTFAELTKKREDVACAERSVHAIFLRKLASRRGIPDTLKKKMLDDWNEVTSDLNFASAVVDFGELKKDCEPSDIGSDALCGGCAVS